MTPKLSVNIISIDNNSLHSVYLGSDDNFDFEYLDRKDNSTTRYLIAENGTSPKNIFDTDNLFLQKKYFQALLLKYFRQQGYPTKKSFIDSIDILVKNNSKGEIIEYKKFNLKIDKNLITERLSLIINYTGISHVIKRPVSLMPKELISKVVLNAKIVHISELTTSEEEEAFPIINRKLEANLGLQGKFFYKEYNKYKKQFQETVDFIAGPLQEVISKPGHIKFSSTNLTQIPGDLIRSISTSSNKLVFGNNNTDYTPLNGLRKYGPLSQPSKKVKFIFIFNERNKNEANTFYLFLKKGFQSFPGLEQLVGIPLDLDREKSIILNCDNEAIPFKISEQLETRNFDDGFKYIAFVFTDVIKDSQDPIEKEIYYKIKEKLLNKGIVSQVIDPQKISNENYGYFLPNIAISVLAKAGGVPWRLASSIEKELVIGIGASRSYENEKTYIGNAICFNNSGTFNGFSATKSTSLAELSEFLKDQITKYGVMYSGVSRLIIHYYKDLSQREASIFEKMLEKLSLKIPYVVLVISKSESEDIIPFDDIYEGKMPLSGTCIKFKPNQYLLCNNPRYSFNPQVKLPDFPFPLKIKIYSSDKVLSRDQEESLMLLDQIYQFSKMYWKSVKQKTRPVTMLYSEFIAEKLSHFEGETPDHPMLEGSLWFL